MPSNTANGYPYPLGTDRVMDGDDAIKNLATAVDTKLGISAAGQAVLPAPAGVTQNTSLAITYPAGRFTTTPMVTTAAIQASAPISSGCSAGSSTGCTLYAARLSGGMASITMYWIARTEG